MSTWKFQRHLSDPGDFQRISEAVWRSQEYLRRSHEVPGGPRGVFGKSHEDSVAFGVSGSMHRVFWILHIIETFSQFP